MCPPSDCAIALFLPCRLAQSHRTPALPIAPPVRPLHNSNFTCLDHCDDRLSPQGKDGGTVYQPVVLDSFPQLCTIQRRPLMNRRVCDKFSIICNTFIRTSYTLTIYQYRSLSPCFNAILAHYINQTNATLGFGPFALFKMSLRCN